MRQPSISSGSDTSGGALASNPPCRGTYGQFRHPSPQQYPRDRRYAEVNAPSSSKSSPSNMFPDELYPRVVH